jgi:predicted dinucleotide-binding enzyme
LERQLLSQRQPWHSAAVVDSVACTAVADSVACMVGSAVAWIWVWESRVGTAFHLVPAAEFAALDRNMESDVVVLADDDKARKTLMEVVESIPDLRAFDGGSLVNAIGMEAFAAVLLTINLRHKGRASMRLIGIEP